MAGELAPRLKVVHEPGIPHAHAVGNRMRAPALYRAEARHHVVPRTRDLRRGARVLVDERLHEDVGTLLLDLLRNGVDEPQQRARMRAFLFAVDKDTYMGTGDAAFFGPLFNILYAGNACGVELLNESVGIGQQLRQRRAEHISRGAHTEIKIQDLHPFTSM